MKEMTREQYLKKHGQFMNYSQYLDYLKANASN
jgi:hypothetical protein